MKLKASSYRYQRYLDKTAQLWAKKKTRVYTEVVLSFLLATFFLIFAIRPTLITISGLVKKIDDQRVVAQKLTDKINALNQARTQYQQIESKLYLVDQALPQKGAVADLTKQLESLARDANVNFQAIQFESVPLKGEAIMPQTRRRAQTKDIVYTTANFNLLADSDYLQLKDFINKIILLRRVITTQKFTFAQERGGANQILSLTAQAHFLKKENQPESISSNTDNNAQEKI